jgi:hypothetical protein
LRFALLFEQQPNYLVRPKCHKYSMATITTLADLVANITTNTYNTQSARDGTSVNTLRINPTSYALASAASNTAGLADTVTTAVVADTTSTLATYTINGTAVVVVQGPQGQQGAQGLPGPQGATGAPGSDASSILPAEDGPAGAVLSTDGNGNLAWSEVNLDFTAQLKQFKKEALINSLVFGS